MNLRIKILKWVYKFYLNRIQRVKLTIYGIVRGLITLILLEKDSKLSLKAKLIIKHVYYNVLEVELNEVELEEFSLIEAEVTELKKECLENESFQKYLSLIDVLTAFYWNLIGIVDKANSHFDKAKKIYPFTTRIENWTDFYDIKRHVKIIKKDLRTELKGMVSLRLDFSTSDLVSLFSIFSVIILISGFFYTYFYYLYFDIDIISFSSVADYVISSLKTIKSALLLSAFMIGIFYLQTNRAISMDEKINEKRESFRLITRPIMIFVFSMSGYFLYVQNNSTQFLVYFLIYILITTYITDSTPHRYFKNGTVAKFSMVFLITYFGLCFSNLGKEIFLKKNEKVPLAIVEFSSSYEKLNKKDLIWLGANTNYYFFDSLKDSTCIVVPKGAVKMVEIKKKPNSTNSNLWLNFFNLN